MTYKQADWMDVLNMLAPSLLGAGGGWILGKVLKWLGLPDLSVILALGGAASPFVYRYLTGRGFQLSPAEEAALREVYGSIESAKQHMAEAPLAARILGSIFPMSAAPAAARLQAGREALTLGLAERLTPRGLAFSAKEEVEQALRRADEIVSKAVPRSALWYAGGLPEAHAGVFGQKYQELDKQLRQFGEGLQEAVVKALSGASSPQGAPAQ